MPNFNLYKTTNDGLFPKVGGVPAWKLNVPANPWDWMIDMLASFYQAFYPFDNIPTSTGAIAVGASPFTYTAGADPEVVYIRGGSVSAIKRNGVTVATASPCTVFLPPGGQVQVTYSSVPTMVADVGGIMNNAAGVTAAISVGASPFTYTAGGRVEIIYITGGSVSSITRNGQQIAAGTPVTVVVPRGGSLTATYSSAPTMVKDS